MGNPVGPQWIVFGQATMPEQRIDEAAAWTLAQTIAVSDGPAVVTTPGGKRFEVWDMTPAMAFSPAQPSPTVAPLPPSALESRQSADSSPAQG